MLCVYERNKMMMMMMWQYTGRELNQRPRSRQSDILLHQQAKGKIIALLLHSAHDHPMRCT